jgi:hypothetical protein
VLKFRSVKSIVIAPASTGRDKRRSTAVIKTDQTNNGVALSLIPSIRMLIIVVIKLIAPRIELTPARCSLKIVKSTECVEWASPLDKGG